MGNNICTEILLGREKDGIQIILHILGLSSPYMRLHVFDFLVEMQPLVP